MGSERICVCGKKVSSMRRSDWCSSICKRRQCRRHLMSGNATSRDLEQNSCVQNIIPELNPSCVSDAQISLLCIKRAWGKPCPRPK